MFAALRVPEHDLVVITGGGDFAVGAYRKTPDLTIIVRVHDVRLRSVSSNLGDGSVTKSNKHVSLRRAINSTDKRVELNAHCAGHG